MTGTWAETLFTNTADHTELASSAAEASLLAGTNRQPYLPADYFVGTGAPGRGIRILARGVLSTTASPTIIFQARLGTTVGSTFLSGTSVGVSGTITCGATVSAKWWELELDLICTVVGQGTTNLTLSGAGKVTSPSGFLTPFIYPIEPSTPDTATWTSTLDGSLRQWLNLSATWGTSSASNKITCKQLIVKGLFA